MSLKLEHLIALHNVLLVEDPPAYVRPSGDLPINPASIHINSFANITDLVRMKKLFDARNGSTADTVESLENLWSQYTYDERQDSIGTTYPVRSEFYYDTDGDGTVDQDDIDYMTDFLLNEGELLDADWDRIDLTGKFCYLINNEWVDE